MASELEILAGKYRLLAPFAEGGMGELWLAEHAELQTTVVVKRMRDWGRNPRALERFRREARAAANLRSRHVIRVFDFGLEESGPYLVMERLHGQDVAQLIDERGPLELGLVRLVVHHTVRALRAAHESGLVHRDIKPSNLFLTREEGEPLVKVLDFGIAKEVAPSRDYSALTGSGALVGSPGYMSPEQVRGQPIDARSDVWSLAAVIYEMLTGRGPFFSEHVGDSLARVCSASYQKVSMVRGPGDFAWDDFFERAFCVEKEGRFQTVDELFDAFTARLGDEPRGVGQATRYLGTRPSGGVGQAEPDAATAAPEADADLSIPATGSRGTPSSAWATEVLPSTRVREGTAPTEWASKRSSAVLSSPAGGASAETLDATHVEREAPRPQGGSRWRFWFAAAFLVALGVAWVFAGTRDQVTPPLAKDLEGSPSSLSPGSTKSTVGSSLVPPVSGDAPAEEFERAGPGSRPVATSRTEPSTARPPPAAPWPKERPAAVRPTLQDTSRQGVPVPSTPARAAPDPTERVLPPSPDAPAPKPEPAPSATKRDPFTGLVIDVK